MIKVRDELVSSESSIPHTALLLRIAVLPLLSLQHKMNTKQ